MEMAREILVAVTGGVMMFAVNVAWTILREARG